MSKIDSKKKNNFHLISRKRNLIVITTFLFFFNMRYLLPSHFYYYYFFLDKMTIWQILWQARVTFNILHNAIISISRIIKWGGKWWRWSYHFLSRNKIFVCRLTSKLKFMFFLYTFCVNEILQWNIDLLHKRNPWKIK